MIPRACDRRCHRQNRDHERDDGRGDRRHGLIAAVTFDIADTSIVDIPTALLALGAFAALMRFHAKLTVLYVVLGCGLIGLGLQLTVV